MENPQETLPHPGKLCSDTASGSRSSETSLSLFLGLSRMPLITAGPCSAQGRATVLRWGEPGLAAGCGAVGAGAPRRRSTLSLFLPLWHRVELETGHFLGEGLARTCGSTVTPSRTDYRDTYTPEGDARPPCCFGDMAHWSLLTAGSWNKNHRLRCARQQPSARASSPKVLHRAKQSVFILHPSVFSFVKWDSTYFMRLQKGLDELS